MEFTNGVMEWVPISDTMDLLVVTFLLPFFLSKAGNGWQSSMLRQEEKAQAFEGLCCGINDEKLK